MPFDAKGGEGAGGAGGGVKGALTRKIGPLPLWGWVVAGAAAVFVLMRLRRGSGSSSSGGGSAAGQGISIPTLQPGGAADGSIGQGGNAVGSPGQNAMAGSDTQPGGAAPWWSTPPAWWTAAPALAGPAPVPTASVPQSGATAGPDLSSMPRSLNGIPLSPVVPESIPPQFRGLYMTDPKTGQLVPKNQN